MSSIRTELIALDTNEYVFAIRADAGFPACAQLLDELVDQLRIYVPLQVIREVHGNLSDDEHTSFYDIIA